MTTSKCDTEVVNPSDFKEIRSRSMALGIRSVEDDDSMVNKFLYTIQPKCILSINTLIPVLKKLSMTDLDDLPTTNKFFLHKFFNILGYNDKDLDESISKFIDDEYDNYKKNIPDNIQGTEIVLYERVLNYPLLITLALLVLLLISKIS